MSPILATRKIRPEHFARLALIYIRQSTLAQVLKNTGSPVLSVQDSARLANTISSSTLSTWAGHESRSWSLTKTRGFPAPLPLTGMGSNS